MESEIDFWAEIKRISSRDHRFKEDVYPYIMEVLAYTIRNLGERRHVSARELLDGLIAYSREKYGLMAWSVLENWGIRSSADIGSAVFNLVEAGVLRKRESDSLADFEGVCELQDALEDKYFD